MTVLVQMGQLPFLVLPVADSEVLVALVQIVGVSVLVTVPVIEVICDVVEVNSSVQEEVLPLLLVFCVVSLVTDVIVVHGSLVATRVVYVI